MIKIFYLVAFVDLRTGTFHQKEMHKSKLETFKLIEKKHKYIQILDSQYIAKGSYT